MWKHCCVRVCAVFALILLSGLNASAQDPSSQPLVQFSDLVRIGGFRLPRAPLNGDDFSIGGKPFTFNPTRNSLFVGTHSGKIAEIAIPELNASTDINTLWFAQYLQGFNDPMEGNIVQLAATDASIEGLLAQNGALYGTAAIYYDANNIQRVSHYSRSTDLAAHSFYGMVPVWQPDHSGFVSGYMATVPPEWQAKLGGPAVTGQCCTPIAWKTSWGPSAFAFNPGMIGATSPVSAQPLLYYSNEHPTLGPWDGSGTVYSATTRIGGLALIQGTRTALYFGSIGTGTHCYGYGTSDASLSGTNGPNGVPWCYDPTNTDKGSHAYPYKYQIWAYDLNDFAAVKAGTKQPWDVVPYGVWRLDLPYTEVHARLGGVAYDPARQVIYLTQMYADVDGYADRALVHALRINNAPATASIPAPTLTPPSGSGTVSTVTLVANKPSPQPPNSTIGWTATPSGGIKPYEYQFWVNNGTGWTNTPWQLGNTFNWTPTAATGNERVAVRVRSYGSLVTYEATNEVWYPISTTAQATDPTPAPTPSPTPPPSSGGGSVTAVSLNANLVSPQAPGTSITWTAAATGGASPQQYQWWLFDGAWKQQTNWTTSNTFTWQPATANANYRIAVWARSGASSGGYEATVEKYFVISGTPVAPAPPPPPPPATTSGSGTVSSVALQPNVSAPQAPGTVVTWTATPSGGVSPQQYQWWVFDGAWTAVTGWTTSNTYAWQPATANANYRVAVWVRGANSTGSYETTAEKYFAISGTAVATPPPPPPPSTTASVPTTGVSLTANAVAPQQPGATITWSATPIGGTAPYQYQWWIYNGSWAQATAWGSANTYAWTPSVANANYRVAVWVRSAGSTAQYEATAERYFAISGAAVTTPPPPPPSTTPSAPPTGVTISANMSQPQLLGTTITWTAAASGGGTYEYQWWTYNGSSWTSQPWTTSNTFAWQPTTASSGSRVAVWVRRVGSTAQYEVTTESYFAIWGS